MNQNEHISNFGKRSNFASKNAKNHYRPNLELEPIHQLIELNFDIPKEYVEGKITTKIKSNSKGKLKIILDAINLSIESINSEDDHSKENSTIDWNYDGHKIVCRWEKEWDREEIRLLTIKYYVQSPLGGLYFSYPTDKEEKSLFVFSDHETERARYWLPCIDHPAVRCNLDLMLTSQKNHTILSNGDLISETETDLFKTSHWKLEFPCPSYLITVCIGELVSYSDRDVDLGNGPIKIAYFTSNKYSSDDLKRTFSKTPEMIEWMSEKLGTPLKYPKYYQYALPQVSGAMENITLVSWDDYYILDETFANEYTRMTNQVNIHELAHSWFGNSVVMKDFSHAWLKESWATYLETVWLEETISIEEANYERYLNEEKYFNETKRYVRPIVTKKFDSSWNLFDSHLYPGGSQRIDMLRKYVGDEIFWNATKDYLLTFENKIVETIDFQRVFENHSGFSLQKFFDQWFYGYGYPKLKISSKFDHENNFIEIKIKQLQKNEDQEIFLFDFDLDIKIKHANGIYSINTLFISEEEHVFYVKADKNPIMIEIDPDHKILAHLELNFSINILKELFQSNSSSSLKNKILAAFELAKIGNLSIIELLETEYKNSNFWGLKLQILEAILSIPQRIAIESYLRIIDVENDPMVQYKAINLLKNKKINFDPMIIKIKSLILNSTNTNYLFKSALLDVYSSYRLPDTLKFLKSIELTTDKKRIIKRGIYNAIGNIRSKEATLYLLNRLKSKENYKETDEVSIIYAISNSLTWAESQFKEEIIEELGSFIYLSNNRFTLKTIATALTSFKNNSVIYHLKKIQRKMVLQEHPFIEKKIRSVSESRSNINNNQSLLDRLDKIEKENLELKDKILKIETLIKN